MDELAAYTGNDVQQYGFGCNIFICDLLSAPYVFSFGKKDVQFYRICCVHFTMGNSLESSKSYKFLSLFQCITILNTQ